MTRERCSGVAAVFCDVHGTCTCPRTGPDEAPSYDDPGCPLHARTSTHPTVGWSSTVDPVHVDRRDRGRPK